MAQNDTRVCLALGGQGSKIRVWAGSPGSFLGLEETVPSASLPELPGWPAGRRSQFPRRCCLPGLPLGLLLGRRPPSCWGEGQRCSRVIISWWCAGTVFPNQVTFVGIGAKV